MTLGRRQHARDFAIKLAEMAVGSARDQVARAGAGLHVSEQHGEARGIASELVAYNREGQGAMDDGVQNDTGDEHLGFLIPVRLA